MQGEESGILNILATEILLSVCNSAIYALGHHWTRNDKHKSLWVFGEGIQKIEEEEMWLECGLSGFPDTSIYMRSSKPQGMPLYTPLQGSLDLKVVSP